MMICPACHCELLLYNDHCENCGAPAYLVTASQAADVTHCTYCGARDEQGSNVCSTCGLKKNFRTSENLIGTCRNCGVAWRNIWMYCETCGVARENGLVDTALPVTVSFQSHLPTASRANHDFTPAHTSGYTPALERRAPAFDSHDAVFTDQDFNAPIGTKVRAMLSEAEVVERMYVNGEDENIAQRSTDLSDFFSESEIADHRRATQLNQVNEPDPSATAVSAAVYDLPLPKRESGAVPNQLRFETTAPVTVRTSYDEVEAKSPPASSEVNPQQVLTSAQTTDIQTVNAETTSAAATTASQPAAKPVQTVRVLNQTRPAATPPVDKRLVKIIAVLIFLILLFSALIVSGFRIRDLFGKPAPQVNSLTEVRPSLSPSQSDQSPTPPEGMVYVPGGVFRMGADDGDSFESPAHEVTLAAFFIDRTEVTNAQYAEFLKATNHRAPSDWGNGQYPQGTDKLPVVNVSWQDASDYAAWAGKRLPTEAEWEYAARANDGRRYPWGSNWDATKANTSESNLKHPVEANSYAEAVHPLGLLNMAGNVWEWTAGEVISYKDSSIVLAPGKVIRGGAFYAPKERATTTYRGFAPPDKQAVGIGFRCVKNIS